MGIIDTDYLITLGEMDVDALYLLYKEAIEKLRNNNTSVQDRKTFTLRVCFIRSIISDKYSLRLRHSTPEFDNPMKNPEVARFFQ